MVWNEREHKQTMDKLEQKSFEEKMRLQQESNQKIEEISMRAQDEALKYVVVFVLYRSIENIFLFFLSQEFK